MEGKKISFGFTKTKKAEKLVVEEKRDYIECLEEQSIKVVGGETVKDETPLIIPLKPNTLVTAERLKEIAEKVEKSLEDVELSKTKEEVPVENESLDQMVVRELLQDANKTVKVETSVLTVPVPAKPVMDGEKESTIDDYESVPIQDFGMAMLRGMGWTPGAEKSKYKEPQLRPKGLGLGADKVVSNKQKKNSKDKEEELTIVKNSFVKITTGKHSGYYGKVVSLDEDNGRVVVDITVKKETVSLSEFMMHPVSKAEYDKEAKVINAGSFEEYKKNEKEKSRNDSSKETNASSTQRRKEVRDRTEDNRREESNGRSNERRRRDSSSSEDRCRQKRDRKEKNHRERKSRDRSRDKRVEKHRDSSSEERPDKRRDEKEEKHRRDSSSSEDRSRQRRKEKKGDKRRDSSNSDAEKRKHKSSKKRYSSVSSDSEEIKKEAKRDIDKKRKGKKKKRDRDRSPHHRKHRK